MPVNLPMGTPLWTAPAVNDDGYITGMQAVLPADSDPTDTPVLAGVIVRDQEQVSSTQYTSLQREGWGLCLVMGPANVGDTLVMSPGNGFLVSQSLNSGPYIPPSGSPVAATLQQVPTNDGSAHLVIVLFGQGGGGKAPASNMILPVIAVNIDGNTLTCGQQITSIVLVTNGQYATAPSVTIAAPASGQQATAVATLVGPNLGSGYNIQITLTYFGSNYTSVPAVTITGGGGSGGATATCTVGPPVIVAMPWELQANTYNGQTVALPNGSHTYAYNSPQVRNDTVTLPDGSKPVLSAVIWPVYLVSHITSAGTPPWWNTIEVETFSAAQLATNVVGCTYIDANKAARRWEVSIPGCYNGVNGFQLVPSAPTANDV